MPLTWNATTVPAANRRDKMFQSAIWNSIAIGIGDLSEKTYAEAVVRTRLVESYHGAYLHEADGTPIYLWPKLHLFVGLKTNVSYESKTKWLGHRYKLWMDDARNAKLSTEEN